MGLAAYFGRAVLCRCSSVGGDWRHLARPFRDEYVTDIVSLQLSGLELLRTSVAGSGDCGQVAPTGRKVAESMTQEVLGLGDRCFKV